MPPAVTNSKYGINLQVLNFDPAPRTGGMLGQWSVSNPYIYLYSKFSYCIITRTLNIALC